MKHKTLLIPLGVIMMIISCGNPLINESPTTNNSSSERTGDTESSSSSSSQATPQQEPVTEVQLSQEAQITQDTEETPETLETEASVVEESQTAHESQITRDQPLSDNDSKTSNEITDRFIETVENPDQWKELFDSGAIELEPDGFVAFRSLEAFSSPQRDYSNQWNLVSESSSIHSQLSGERQLYFNVPNLHTYEISIDQASIVEGAGWAIILHGVFDGNVLSHGFALQFDNGLGPVNSGIVLRQRYVDNGPRETNVFAATRIGDIHSEIPDFDLANLSEVLIRVQGPEITVMVKGRVIFSHVIDRTKLHQPYAGNFNGFVGFRNWTNGNTKLQAVRLNIN